MPLLAMKILKYNQQAKQKINLKGLVLISPWADPIQQQSMDATYAFYHGLITQNQTIHLDKIYQQCKQLILAKQYLQANHICGKLDVQIKQFSKRHLCNIAYTQTQNNVLLDQYLRQPSVLKAIHATQSKPFKTWSESVNKNYDPIIQRSLLSVYNQLLKKHLPILIFSGLNDAKDTNYLGIEKFIQALKWDEKSSYLNAKRKNCGIGYSKMGGGLEWVTVFNAGHMVPQDQPKISGIVQKFTQPIVF
ncbi:MAG: hypothetical protein ACD_29C00276G0002 [uncultured bacterium]|nr:MAG: hypothetical protein ACD_29C00276G0002 [uncultured bacterium]